MSDDRSRNGSGAAVVALKTHDILCHVFEVDRPIANKRKLSHKDLLRCALVSRAFCEPALRALWTDMSPPTPLWRLLALTDSTSRVTSEFFDDVNTVWKLYTDPIRWARFMWYARFVREVHIKSFCFEHKHRELIHTLVAHNGGESIFPSLQMLWWSPSSYSDESYFPLFTPQLRSALFNFPRFSKLDTGRPDKYPRSHMFLSRLRASSPRLDYLSVNAGWELGVNHSLVISSFEHLTGVNLTSSITLASFRELAAMPHMQSLRIAYVRSDEPEPPPPPVRIPAPRLTFVSVGGNCPSLTRLFNALDAPVLASASFHAICDNPDAERDADYDSCIKALATVGSAATMEDLYIALDEDGGPVMFEYLIDLIDPLLAFHNLTRFSLSCPMVGLVAHDCELWAVTCAWPKLQTFKIWQAYWDPCIDPDDEDSKGIPIPTPEVLESFRDHCPDLRELVLPHLDFDADVPTRYIPKGGSRHGLKVLAFGAKELGGDDEDWVQGFPEPDNGQVTDWARYILDLFPKLDTEKSLTECSCRSTETSWVEVFMRAGDLRKPQTRSSPGGAVLKSSGR